MKKYDLNLKNQLRLLIYPILAIIFAVSLCFFLELSLKIFCILILSFSPLYLIPNLYLHFNHYNYFIGKTYIFQNGLIIEKYGDDNFEYRIDDVEELIFHATKGKLSGTGIKKLPYWDYYFATLKFKDGKQLILSSILSVDINYFLYETFKVTAKVKDVEDFFPLIEATSANSGFAQ